VATFDALLPDPPLVAPGEPEFALEEPLDDAAAPDVVPGLTELEELIAELRVVSAAATFLRSLDTAACAELAWLRA
jgi:hypothetical protein